jgi:[methyl-Co(III) methanol-specific corrinoid protein]:coenzyme M methyltransferase
MVHAGADAISIGQGTSIINTKEIVKGRCQVIGNIDPSGVLLNGTPKQVEKDVRRCMKDGVDIAAPGCGVSPMTPLENLLAMTDAIRKYGRTH